MFRTKQVVVAAVCVAALVSSCRHTPTPREIEASYIHYDLGIQAQQAGQMQEAYTEFEEALRKNPKNVQAHHAQALLLHHAFGRHDEALGHFRRALELEPLFSEAKVNLGNLHLDRQEYARAAKLYQEALQDMRYRTPEFAQVNLGWAEYKRGNVEKGLEHTRSSVTLNPDLCLGYRNLGTMLDELGRTQEACVQFSRYREKCPDMVEAYYREGMCLAKEGRNQEAAQRFVECEAKAPMGDLKDDCRRYGAELQ